MNQSNDPYGGPSARRSGLPARWAKRFRLGQRALHVQAGRRR